MGVRAAPLARHFDSSFDKLSRFSLSARRIGRFLLLSKTYLSIGALVGTVEFPAAKDAAPDCRDAAQPFHNPNSALDHD